MIDAPDQPYRPDHANDDIRRARHDDELRMDAELAESSAGGDRITLFAFAVAVVLGAVFYELNLPPTKQAGASSTAQHTQSSPPVAPPGMRDLTPRANTEKGVTTGATPVRLQTPPAKNPPANNTPGR